MLFRFALGVYFPVGWSGFVKFTAGWRMVLITKRSVVALIGGHYLYRGYGHAPDSAQPQGRQPRRGATAAPMVRQVDVTKNFYFSYTYDVTSTLQRNLTRVGANEHGLAFVGRFAWNHRYARARVWGGRRWGCGR